MYDLIILGGGPAGYHAAEHAAIKGLNAVVIEKKRLGGVCLNEGCIPSKTLLNSSKLYYNALHSKQYGVVARDVSFDLATVMEHKQKVVDTLVRGIGSTLKKNKVTVEEGEGKILPKKGSAFQVAVGEKVIEGARLLICTGSEAIRIPIPGADQDFVYTNREILSIDSLPGKLVIIGGGIIGLEFACLFSELGVDVTVVELLPSVGGPIDSDISGILQQALEKKGAKFHLKAKVSAVGDHAVTFDTPEGKSETIPADIVLMSVGRRPIVKGFGLENINVQTERGAIVVDDQGRTNVPNVWAAGDVNGRMMLAHTAYREADVCISDMTGGKQKTRYHTIPGVIYTHPEVAYVGYTEEEAKKNGYDVVTATLPMSFNGRYLAEHKGERGICKVIVEKQYRQLVGVHMIGGACSEMIFGAAAMMEDEMRVQDIEEIVFPHPTASEIIKDTLLQIRL